MKKWEYLNVTHPDGFFRGPEAVTKFCNQYGEEGWEMVNFCYDWEDRLMCFMFKREKE